MARYRPAHLAPHDRAVLPLPELVAPASSGTPSQEPQGPLHFARARQFQKIRRRRLAFRSLTLVVLAGIGVSIGGVVSKVGRPTATTLANGAETEPTVTTPPRVVGGQPGQGSQVSATTEAENALPGSADWKLSDRADHHEIEGYADATSVNHGEPVTLYVSTDAPTFHAEVYRMGFYQGLGGRLVVRSDDVAGARQAAATVTPVVNMVEAAWSPSLVLPTSTWPAGDYLVKLVASTGKQRYLPLTVRDDASTATFVLINSVTTWQAYNLWGGYDLYEGQTPGGATDFRHRSRVVSFDRPYTLGDGAGDFLGLEYPLVSFVESLGLDVAYLTDIDLQRNPSALLAHKAVFSLGHDEYYSQTMRNALEQARDQGVNLAFLGANAVFRHIRLAPSPIGPNRHEIDYKSAREDPLFGKDNADVTVDWREPPNNNPESQLIGNFYQCNPVRAAMVVVDPSSWLFAGTGATAGQKLPNVVGSEYDRYDPTVAGPPNVEILTHSPVHCGGKADFADATYYSAPSGAGVFAAGTIDWVGNIDTHCQPAGCAGRMLGLVMQNLLKAFQSGPAGLAHPSNPAQSTVRSRPPSTTIVPTTGAGSSSAAGVPAGREQE